MSQTARSIVESCALAHIAPSPLGAPRDARDRDAHCDRGSMRILLVDCHTEARTAIARWLDEFFAHVEIEEAASAAEAVISMRKSMPDLIITAHAIPALDGIALASIVKSRPNPPPVVVLATGCGGGVDLWLEKRHVQAVLLDFLQRRFPEIWARSVAQRKMAWAH